MKKQISFPSIEQFRNIVANVNRQISFVGLDENGDAIYDNTKIKPTLTFKGTVKLHGTNAGVCFNELEGLWAQSRENIITPEHDNAGFAFFVKSNEQSLLNLISDIKNKTGVDLNNNTISIYFEWAGKGIQKNVGISEIKKSAFIIGVKITPHVENEEELKLKPAYWVDSSSIRDNENNIYNILDFKTYEINIDFNKPDLSINKILDLTLAVENECPVSKYFGIDGIGEGIVFTHVTDDGKRYMFKSKGEKHAGKSKVKTINAVDDVKINKAIEIAEKVTPTWRLAQMIENAFNISNGGELNRAKLGTYIKMVIDDVIKEDLDILVEADLEPKDVSKYVSEIARRYFFDQENIF